VREKIVVAGVGVAVAVLAFVVGATVVAVVVPRLRRRPRSTAFSS
jgi:hypothetical protein